VKVKLERRKTQKTNPTQALALSVNNALRSPGLLDTSPLRFSRIICLSAVSSSSSAGVRPPCLERSDAMDPNSQSNPHLFSLDLTSSISMACSVAEISPSSSNAVTSDNNRSTSRISAVCYSPSLCAPSAAPLLSSRPTTENISKNNHTQRIWTNRIFKRKRETKPIAETKKSESEKLATTHKSEKQGKETP
jgi:hypothetical protein